MFNKLSAVWCVALTLAAGASAQETVNVQPGDDLEAAVAQAGPGGTVIFAPGVYNMLPSDLASDKGLVIGPELEGITLQGAGAGFGETSASILDGNGGFLGSAFLIEANDAVVDGFLLTNFWDESIEVEDAANVEIRNCWMIANKYGIYADGAAGAAGDSPTDFSGWVRVVNCVFAKNLEMIKAFDTSLLAIINCDIRDAGGDIFEPEQSGEIYVLNSIIDRGYFGNDLQNDGDSVITFDHTVFYGRDAEDGAPIESEFDLSGGIIITETCIFANPMYTNASFDVSIRDYDFTLQPGSPALTAGIGADGNPTFAGSAGPAQ